MAVRWGFAADLYGLGATCIHLLTGRSPLELYDLAADRWVWQAALPQPISPALAQILDRLLARSLDDRYALASEVLRDLKVLATPNRKRSQRSHRASPNSVAAPQGGSPHRCSAAAAVVPSAVLPPTPVSGPAPFPPRPTHKSASKSVG